MKRFRKFKRLISSIRYSIGKIIGPIWYRFFGYKHHIIKTSLTPAVWYDVDDRILFAVMDTVKWYVDNDMMDVWTEKAQEEELKRVEEEHQGKFKEEIIEQLKSCFEADKVALEIVAWWENYLNREKEIREENNSRKAIALEDKLDEEEQEMLIKAIKFRNTMWS
ncbi:MAG TPA: hypothetical protein VMV86_05000 [Methanosarcinales archaeon]|nr:hypothetical protein [Methanosarcinales archaeon]